MPSSAKYVYGVVRAGVKAPGVRGVGRRAVRLVQGDGVSALVSDVPEGELEAGREDLLAHAKVLEKALAKEGVLPMRFGVAMPDEQAVRAELLDAFHDELLAQLAELEDKVELHLRATYDEAALMREIVEHNPAIGARSERLRSQPADATYYERIELGQLVSEAVERARDLDTAAIVHTLEPLAAAIDIGEPEHERVAAHLSFLVAREVVADFDAAVDELGRENEGRLHFKYTGPLPPYTFVQLPVEA